MEKKSEFEQAIEEHIEAKKVVGSQSDPVDVESTQKEYDKFITNPENRQRATILANQIKEKVGKNWFTFQGVCDKLNLFKAQEQQDMAHSLAVLIGFGLCVSKMGDDDVPKNKKGKTIFKIVMDYLAQIDLIDHDVAYHQAKVQVLIEQREKIVEKQKLLIDAGVANECQVTEGAN